MPSPFPGMDPYIESSGVWADFPHGLIGAIKHAVTAVLPGNYVARAGERSYVVLVSPGLASHRGSVGYCECICPQHKRNGD